MTRGRKPKPTALKILSGNPGKRPLNGLEPQPEPGLPECPDHLDEVATEEWERISRELLTLGLLTQIDRAALAVYCQTWSRWVQSELLLQEEGEILEGKEGGTYPNPRLHIANRAMEQMKSALADFGMTPSSRTRISVANPTGQSSALAQFAAQKHA